MPIIIQISIDVVQILIVCFDLNIFVVSFRFLPRKNSGNPLQWIIVYFTIVKLCGSHVFVCFFIFVNLCKLVSMLTSVRYP